MTHELFSWIPGLNRMFCLSVGTYSSVNEVPNPPGAFRFLWWTDGASGLGFETQTLVAKAPCWLALGSRDRVQGIDETCRIRAAVFRPNVVNDAFENSDPYNLQDFRGSALDDLYYLHPFVLKEADAFGPREIDTPTIDRFQDLFDRMETALSDRDDGYWPCRTRSHFLELLILVRQSTSQPKPASLGEKVVAYLHLHYGKPISIESLTKLFSTNRTTLSAQFKAETGTTVVEYLRRFRIEVAKTLLRDTTLPVKAIRDRVSIPDPSHFVRWFKKMTGSSPIEYRKSNNWILSS